MSNSFTILVAINNLILICFVIWRERETRRQVSELTNKIMAKSYPEYSVMSVRKESSQAKKDSQEEAKKPRRVKDPVLGGTY